MATEIKREQFTQREAAALVGKMFESLVEFSGVPKGTRGKAIKADRLGDGFDVVIEWNLGPRTKPLCDWFTRDELQRFMQEVKP